MHKKIISAALLALLLAAAALGSTTGRLQLHEKGIWSIAGTKTHRRWIVVHNLREAARTGIYHIEVLQRGKNDPKWKIDRIRPHLAITEQALERSVLSPLSSGAVYPESFDDAYRQWKLDEKQGNAFVCTTSVLECLGTGQGQR